MLPEDDAGEPREVEDPAHDGRQRPGSGRGVVPGSGLHDLDQGVMEGLDRRGGGFVRGRRNPEPAAR